MFEEERTVLVVGGAGGIGAAITRRLAGPGIGLVVADLRGDDGEALAASLRAENHACLFRQVDATDEAAIAELFEWVASQTPPLAAAVNVVGADLVPLPPDIADIALADWDRTVRISLTSTFLCMRGEIPLMAAIGGGAIVNVTSLAGLRPAMGASPAYGAAKAGVVMLTQWAAVRHAEDGIRVNCVAPGLTRTETVAARVTSERERELLTTLHAIHRYVEPSEIADAVAWLVGNDAAMVTGHVLPVDGGWAAR